MFESVSGRAAIIKSPVHLHPPIHSRHLLPMSSNSVEHKNSPESSLQNVADNAKGKVRATETAVKSSTTDSQGKTSTDRQTPVVDSGGALYKSLWGDNFIT